MKKYIFCLTAISALAISSCRKIETDGEKEVIVITQPGTGGGNTGQTITLSGRISADTILRKENTYILKGLVYMVGDKTMTIEAGTTIKGAYSGNDVAALIITRGAKIVANGTQEAPIVFTSSSPTPKSGDWGGIVLCGKAGINTSVAGANGGPGMLEVEGGINNAQGDGLAGGGATPNDDDSSGVLKYVRIEYAGYAFQPDKEINSLTMAAVGRKTVIEHVQVTYAKDDAFEWFGGTVNCKYLIAYKTQDDDFDSDNGFRGSVQFGLIIRDSAIADISKSEAFESDNNSTGTDATPQTGAVFCNVTAFGPTATLNNIGNSNYLGAAVQIRRNSSISIFNSAFVGWPIGIQLNASQGNTDFNATSGKLQLAGIIIAGATKKPLEYVANATPTANSFANEAAFTAWFNDASRKNRVLTTVDDARYTRPFDYMNPDWQPFGNSPVVLASATNTYFTDPILVARPYIQKVDFIGGIGPSAEYANWYKGWTRFN
jgi:hypothetical protein